jgi:DNA-binding CsgD family transcriptional regulator/tetratricopeptide (TPR) repeat protein
LLIVTKPSGVIARHAAQSGDIQVIRGEGVMMPGRVVTKCDRGDGLPAVAAPAFTGRGRELAELAAALAGPAAVVLIEGEAGIGKTRLLREYLATPEGQALSTLTACCPPFRQPHTLGPLADAIRDSLQGGVRGLGLTALAGALRPLFPEWADGLPPAPEPAEDATAARHRLFAALAELLGLLRLSVLVVEDVHWADEATVEFLLYLAARPVPADQPMRLVVTCRSEDVPAGSLLPRLSRLAAGARGLRLTMGPLDVAGTAGLMSSMLAAEPVSQEFAGFVHEHTDGVPLAVEESVRLMASRGDVCRRDQRWVRRLVNAIVVPPTVRDAVLERAGRLTPDARAVLCAAAVLAVPAGEATLRVVARLPAARTRSGLSEALGSALLAEDGRGLASFRHALAARAVYEAIPGPQRRVLHQRAGRALEEASPPPVAQLAQHFRAAGDTGRWAQHAGRAAEIAHLAGDDTTAAVLLHDLVTGAGLPAGEMARLADKIVLLAISDDTRLRDLAAAFRAVLGARNLAPGEEAGLHFQLGRVLLTMGETDASRPELERAVPHLPAGSVQAARAMLLLGWPSVSACPAAVHLRWLRRAADAAASVPPAEQPRMLVDRATALLLLGEESGWAEAARIPWDAAQPRDRLQITRGHGNLAELAIIWGRYEEAGRRLAQAHDLASRYHYPRLRDTVQALQIHLDWLTGAWHPLTDQAARLADAEVVEARLRAVLVTGLAQAAVGDRASAGDCLRHVLDETCQRGAIEQTMDPAAALARLSLADGRVDEALQVTADPAGVLAGKGIWVWAADLAPARVSALIAAGRAAEAARLTAAFARGLRGRNAARPKAGLALCRAQVIQARGEHVRAAGLFARAATAWQALPQPYDALLARESQAGCLLAAGQADTALPVLAEAERGLSALGATDAAARAARVLREHGAAPRQVGRTGRRSYGHQLSPRELDVVRLVLTGKTNREIAEALCRSPKTVDTQLGSAMRKLNVSSRTALAVSAMAAGLAADDQSQAGAGESAVVP